MKHLFLFISIALMGCSNGFQSSSDGDGNPEDISQTPINRDLQASVASGPFEGSPVLNNVRDSRLEVQLPLGLNGLAPSLEFSISELGLTGRIQADSNGLKTLVISIPYPMLLRGVSAPPTSQLPTGTPLNVYFTGRDSVPHVSFNLDSQGQVRGYLYIDPPRFGLFLQTPFDLSVSRTYPINLDNSFMTIGSFSTHPHASGQNGGVFLFISLPQ